MLRRLERSTHGANPLDHYFYVDGVQVGELSNNGGHDPSRDDYTGTIQTRTMKASTSDFPFRWNQSGGATAGQFGGSGYDPISLGSNGMQGSGSRYTTNTTSPATSAGPARSSPTSPTRNSPPRRAISGSPTTA